MCSMGLRGDRLKSLRESQKLSQEGLGELLKVTQQQISRWESQSTQPDGDFISRMAITLKVSADYLLGLSDDPLPYSKSSDLTPEHRELLVAYDSGAIMELIYKLSQKARADELHKTDVSREKPTMES